MPQTMVSSSASTDQLDEKKTAGKGLKLPDKRGTDNPAVSCCFVFSYS
jgi:hypothetical protein